MIYIGTVANSSGSVKGNGEGVYTAAEDKEHNLIIRQVIPSDNAGIITLSSDRRHIYAANESRSFGGMNGSGGGVTAFRIEENGELVKINDSLSYGSRPAYVSVTDDGRYLLAANHGSHSTVTCSYVRREDGGWELQRGFDDASAALFSLRPDGGIGELKDLTVFRGSGYWCHGGGQSASHIHCIKERNDMVFACNRGADEIEVMKIDREKDKLVLLNQFHVRSGYAPRYSVFHPEKKLIYVLNENYPSISVYSYDDSGCMEEIFFCGTMPADYYREKPLPGFSRRHADINEKNTCGFADRKAAMPSDIKISDDGRFLYASNRYYAGGSIAVFRILPDGTLRLSGHIPLAGNDPRGFAVKNGLLYAGLLDRNSVQVFALDRETGLSAGCLSLSSVPAPSSFIII